MKKFPKIRYPGDEETDGLLNDDVVVTEKLDGANFRFTFDENGNVVCGSRNVKFTEDGEPLPLEEINSAFRHAIEYLREVTPDEIPESVKGTTFYGEAMHLHSLEYEDIDYEKPSSGPAYPGGDTPNVVIFDARHNSDWLNWYDVVVASDILNLELTRVIDHGDPDECSFEVPAESVFGGPPEGIVVRRIDGDVRAKKVTEDFKEQSATTFNDPSKAQSDAAEFVAMFVTDARIEKSAHKLVDEGEYDQLEMPMMEDLPLRVIRDVVDEEGYNLFMDEYGFEAEFDSDFKYEVRSKVSDRCARRLRGMLNEF